MNILIKTCTVCKESKALDEFPKHPQHKDGYNSVCKKCMQKSNKKCRLNKKIHFIKKMGGECTNCKIKLTENNWPIFDFYHIDPSQKEVSWSTLRNWSNDKIEKELNKCTLLCANCHRLLHAKTKD